MKKSILVTLLVLSLFIISACSKTVYICANGQETEEKETCPYNKISKVSSKDADKFSTNFVTGFLQAQGGRAKFVSSYADKGDYFVTFIVNPKDNTPYETVVQVDGITGKVKCTENCQYSGS